MADPLVALGRNRTARKLVGVLGVSLPPTLARDSGPWRGQPLEDKQVLVLVGPQAGLLAAIADTLAQAGAEPAVVGDLAPFAAAAEAWGRPARAATVDERPDIVVMDVSGLSTIDDLHALYDLLHPRIRAVRSSGRVVVLSRPPADASDVEQRVVRRAVEGFMRSVAKELGRKGATANQVVVPEGFEDRLNPVLRWLATPRSAYVSGQVLAVSRTVRLADPAWTRPLDGKVALVTGAARGIGE
ncbi:MAG: short chain dehydrogenase, partial [Deltaproteobacteria bacterium]